MLRPALLAASLFVLLSCRPEAGDRNTSGGPLSARQAAFDVTYYDLSLRIDPDARRIEGVLRLDARLTAPLDSLELDLDDRLVVSAVRALPSREELGFVQLGGKLVFPLSAPGTAEPSPPARSARGTSSSAKPSPARSAPEASGLTEPSPQDQSAQGVSGSTDPSVAHSAHGTSGAAETSASAESGFVSFEIVYGGVPRVAPNPPWDGGFTWKTTAEGLPWFAVSCQAEGADLWWPVKDHPSDEPDSMRISVTVPAGLTALSNGRLRSVVDEEGVSTFEWFVSTPINNYGVTLAVGPYERLAYPYRHADGLDGEIEFWVLPESRAEAERSLPHFADQVRFMEALAGPFPFRADKLGFVQTPYLGMEHQTLIAYGDRFAKNAYGFDWLFLHELAHEWYGNLVTAADWKDMWLHEGFATYAEALYAEEVGGEAAYLRYMAEVRRKIANRKPLAPRESRTTTQVYFTADLRRSDPDVYVKGAFVLHLLRYLGGREAIQTVLRRWAYPDPEWEGSTDCRACRLATSDEFIGLAEEVLGRDLGWFFDVLLRESAMPVLHVEEGDSTVVLRWEAPGDRVFPMPVEVELGGRRLRLELPAGTATIPRAPGDTVRVDPDGWVNRSEGPGVRR